MQYNNSVKSVALGSFDGIHSAHKELISLVDEVVVIERGVGSISKGFKRYWFTNKPLSFLFLDKIKHLNAKEFIELLKSNYPNLQKIVVGYDFRFAKDKLASWATLQRVFDGEVVVIDEVTIDALSVHTRTIKSLLQSGKLDTANRLLGRNYSIDGYHIKGQGIGSKELLPTINIECYGYVLPYEGVYITKTAVNNRWYNSVSFIGYRVTTDNSFAIETHLLDIDEIEPRGRIFIEFCKYLRQNRRFGSLPDLKKQIESDCQKAYEYHYNMDKCNSINLKKIKSCSVTKSV